MKKFLLSFVFHLLLTFSINAQTASIDVYSDNCVGPTVNIQYNFEDGNVLNNFSTFKTSSANSY